MNKCYKKSYAKNDKYTGGPKGFIITREQREKEIPIFHLLPLTVVTQPPDLPD